MHRALCPAFLCADFSELTHPRSQPHISHYIQPAMLMLHGSAAETPIRPAWHIHIKKLIKKLDLLDYHDIVKYPMDLRIIMQRIEQEKYMHPDEVAADTRLTFRSAQGHNQKGSDVYAMAVTRV